MTDSSNTQLNALIARFDPAIQKVVRGANEGAQADARHGGDRTGYTVIKSVSPNQRRRRSAGAR